MFHKNIFLGDPERVICWTVADGLIFSLQFDCREDVAHLSPQIFPPRLSPCWEELTISGLWPVCSPVSSSTTVVLSLYLTNSMECGQHLIYRTAQLVRLSPLHQLNSTHANFSTEVRTAQLSSPASPVSPASPAYCLLVKIGTSHLPHSQSGGDFV